MTCAAGRAVAGLCCVLGGTGCTEAEDRAGVAVRWSLAPGECPGGGGGTCADVGADAFRLLAGEAGDPLDRPCADGRMTLDFPLRSTVELAGELVAGGEPITDRLVGPAFPVTPGGVDVEFSFHRGDFRKTSDYRFTISFAGEPNCGGAGVTEQRVALLQDGEPVAGAQVCWHHGLEDEECVAADGSPGPCRERGDVLVIPDLPWGGYRINLRGEARMDCFLSDSNCVEIDFSRRVINYVLDPTGAPCE